MRSGGAPSYVRIMLRAKRTSCEVNYVGNPTSTLPNLGREPRLGKRSVGSSPKLGEVGRG